jgi:hypothetical protein
MNRYNAMMSATVAAVGVLSATRAVLLARPVNGAVVLIASLAVALVLAERGEPA